MFLDALCFMLFKKMGKLRQFNIRLFHNLILCEVCTISGVLIQIQIAFYQTCLVLSTVPL